MINFGPNLRKPVIGGAKAVGIIRVDRQRKMVVD